MPEVTKLACSICGRTDREVFRRVMSIGDQNAAEPTKRINVSRQVDLCEPCEKRAIKFMERGCTPPPPRKGKATDGE